MPFNQSSAPRVLIVEDEAAVSILIEDMLDDIGCVVFATAARIDIALAAAQNGSFDAAVLDVNVAGSDSYAVADVLRRRGIPFVFSTGYGASGMKNEYLDVPVLQKPFHTEALEAALRRALTDGAR